MKTKRKKVKVHSSAIQLLTDTTWKFAHSVLWNYFPFSEDEVETARLYIKEYYLRIPAKKFQNLALNYFRNYRTYIRLAAKYIARLPQPYLASPALWLNRKQIKRFCNTKAKHHCMLLKRSNKCLPMQQCTNCPLNQSSDFHFTA